MVNLAYIDSSVLVKHYIATEEASGIASGIIQEYQAYTSSIAQIEVFSALSRKLHIAEVAAEDIDRIKADFLSDCKQMGIVEVKDEIIREAQRLVFTIPVKSLDAIHLSSAITLKKITGIAFPFVTADKQLAAAAEKEGFEVLKVGL